MPNKPVLQIAVVCLALVSAYVSLHLYAKHMTGASGVTWFDEACSSEQPEGGADCDTVLASDYGVFPFIDLRDKEDEDETPALLGLFLDLQSHFVSEDTQHVPVTLLGLAYYSMIVLWMIGIGRPSFERRWLHGFAIFMTTGSFVGCLFFVYIMFTVTTAWCPWCMVTHVLNLLITACIWLMWPRLKETTASTSTDAPPKSEKASKPKAGEPPLTQDLRPSTRQAVVTVLAMTLVGFAGTQLHLRSTVAKDYKGFSEQCMAKLKEFTGDGKKMMRNWQLQEKHTIEVGEDPSTRGGKKGQKYLKCIVFSDFECPSCRVLSHFMDKKVQPLFDGHLKIIFKHYPLDKECNPNVSRSMHPHACKAAAFAETARLQGGNEAFWKAHDYFFENRQHVKKLTVADFTTALGLDVDRFNQDLESKAFARRIFDDITEGKKLELRSTPSVFVGGKRISGLAVKDLDFWDEMASFYWRTVKVRRPEGTKIKKRMSPAPTPATPSNQDQPDAP